MNSVSRKVMSLVACFAVAMAGAAFAQEAPAADAKAPRAERRGGGQGMMQGAGQKIGAAKQLTLTDEQKKKVEELEKKYKDEMTKIREESRKKMQEAGTSATAEQRRAIREELRPKMTEINKTIGDELDAILTAEQKAEIATKMKEMMQQRAGRMGGAPGAPEAPKPPAAPAEEKK